MGERKRRQLTLPMQRAHAYSLRQQGQLQAALAAFRAIVALAPDDLDAWTVMGDLSLQLGQPSEALTAFSRALELQPGHVAALRGKASTLEALGRLAQAADVLDLLCEADPDNATHCERLGIARQTLGDLGAAEHAYRLAMARMSRPGLIAKLATLVSPIPTSAAAILDERQRIDRILDQLLQLSPVADSDPIRDALWPNFYLAFQGKCNRELHARFAEAYRHLYPRLTYTAPHCHGQRNIGSRRLRIGFISRYFFNHSISRTSRGLIATLPRERFEVFAICAGKPPDDEYARHIARHADHHLVVPLDLVEARQRIEALSLDVLYYQDIGMDPFTYFLSFSRLAPVQCVSFGHPDTTGVPTMDYFISSTLFEPPEASAHYSESLCELQDIGTLAYYYRPTLSPRQRTRGNFGLPDNVRMYLCPQNLFKIHPDMDPLFAQILERDPEGLLVLIRGHHPRWTQALLERWKSWPSGLLRRVRFLDRLDSTDFVTLIALADVVLDTVHFNGMNTSLEAFAVGTPVVTWPGALQRGRHTFGMYRRMGESYGVASDAEHFVELALTIAREPDLNHALRNSLRDRSTVLFEDPRVTAEFARCFDALSSGG